MRRVSVLLRVTLHRRRAELSFRGVVFTELPQRRRGKAQAQQ